MIVEIDTSHRTVFIWTSVKMKNAFDESKVNRDNKGQFTEKAGGRGDEGNSTDGNNKMIKTEDFLGKEYKGVKGQAAVDLLMKERQGFVRDAFTRKDIGDIALIWGNDNMGLQHIIKRRKATNQPLGRLLLSLTEVIEKGEIIREENGDFAIRYKGKRAIIEPQLFNNKFQFLMTAYYEK